MDAGNFNLNWNVGPNRFNKAPGPNQNQTEDTRDAQDKGPRDEVNFGSFPLPLSNPEVRTTEQTPDAGLIANPGSVAKSEQAFSLSGPLALNSLSGVDSTLNIGGGGLTAVNGLNSTSFYTVNGVNVASVNPLNPSAGVKLPTTSVGAAGIEDTSWVTSSGRVISIDERPSVKMPTTSVDLVNGLESTELFTYNGNIVRL
jgi:hypothetical protein